jgi:ubiquitin-activating enzyme E1
MPRLMNELDSRICVRTAKRINKRLKIVNKIDEELIKKLVKYSKIQICAIVSIWGGIIAQEILKITGKYLSIFQWAYLDFSELLINSSIPKQVDRYFGIKLFIGEEAFQILQNKKTLIVGAGALGCELIKHLAVLGVSKNTPVVVTDNDSIELSNLSRQFLFRRENIGQSKSKTAVNAALQINPAAKMQAYDKKVCQSSESFFMDEFWDSLDVVFLAVDNIEARNYVDSKCVNHKKMLLESGTLGMQASSQTIIPFQTLTYRDIPRGTTKSIPMCTLKSFPYLVLHCIEWARDLFEEIFDVSLKVLNSFNSDPQSFCEELLIMSNMNLKYEKLCQLLNILFLRKIENKKKIIKGTCELFICYFRDNILDLIYHNPIDQKNIDGTLYWSGTKRFPIAANIDLSAECINFLHACCKIFMSSVNLSFEISELEIKEFILNYKSSDFKPRLFGQDEKIQEFVDNHIEKLINLPKVSKIFESVAFEKDDDSNYHIEFIVNASNIRAKSYKLEQTDRQNSKMIAGRIIPAIASTTSVVSGFVALEFIKSSIFKNITFFKNSSINLSIPIIRLMNPSKPLKLKDSEENESIYTVWDSIEILGPLTLEEFLAYFKEKYNSNVLSASIGEFVLYHFTMAKEYEFFMKSKIEDEYQTISGNKIDSWKKWIDIIVEIGKENNTERILLPIIRYKI